MTPKLFSAPLFLTVFLTAAGCYDNRHHVWEYSGCSFSGYGNDVDGVTIFGPNHIEGEPVYFRFRANPKVTYSSHTVTFADIKPFATELSLDSDDPDETSGNIYVRNIAFIFVKGVLESINVDNSSVAVSPTKDGKPFVIPGKKKEMQQIFGSPRKVISESL